MTGHDVDGAIVRRDVLRGLKRFQRKTVDHVFRRMYLDRQPTTRFLVADEVGLGKTLVARGIIARAIERLQQERPGKRIDVIYVCSNADIAQQNIQRLNVTGRGEFSFPTRLTLLPLELRRLNENGINFVSLTPGTSLTMSSRSGRSRERAVLFHLLRRAIGTDAVDHEGSYRLLAAWKGLERFREEVAWVGLQEMDVTLANAFAADLREGPDLRRRFRQVSRRLADPHATVDWNVREDLIRDLRLTLARSCIAALQPDLVILDEFQRFKELLEEPDPDDPDDIRALAHHLFRQEDVRILLLSATPYKMFTLSDERDDDHYADFLQTTRFLMSADDATAFARELRDYRRTLLDIGVQRPEVLEGRRRAVEKRLRRVMVRTERLAVTADRSGMLTDRKVGTRLARNDIRRFAMIDALSRELGTGDPTEFWKSAPYLLNFMERYQLKNRLRASIDGDGGHRASEIIERDLLLRRADLEAYREIDPGNARLRGIADDLFAAEAWRLLWVPPALPYYLPDGPFAGDRAAMLTKRLIFSSWTVVPQAVSTLLSYEAERRMMLGRDADARNDQESRSRLRGLLALRRADGAPAGMSTFALLYPSPALAAISDPLAVARDLGAANGAIDRTALEAAVRDRIAASLDRFTRRAPTDGPEDERWYWVAPLLLDRRRDVDRSFAWIHGAFRTLSHGADPGDEDGSGWSGHVDAAAVVLRDGADLGRVPADLLDALTALAIGSPALCGLRAVARTVARTRRRAPDLWDEETRDAAARIAWGFRSLFNVPEVMALVRGPLGDESVYWRAVLDYCAVGNLQATLDEYAHVLPDWLGIADRGPATVAGGVGEAIAEAASIRAVPYQADEVRVRPGHVSIGPMRIRARFAMRFGVDQGDEAKQLHRAGAVRTAFNSPFWPFVLTSTSVGQEGLDFHQYCHAVVHWNLPANPVDLEQREGRVHRYKGHAVRKNVAARHRAAAFAPRVVDPWAAMFEEASRTITDRVLRDIQPYWVYEGPARIERHVPLIPLSREVERLERLRKSLAAYRMVFGQPRQEDLIAYLGAGLAEDQLAGLAERLRIDLSPKG